MKSTTLFHSVLASFFILFSLLSCSEKKFSKEFKTPEMAIQITGNKPNALDPFTVCLIATHEQSKKKITLNIEVFANDLNDTNPTFQSIGTGKYALIFNQTDNTNRELILSVEDDEVLLEEIL
jgi:hypothetical protein